MLKLGFGDAFSCSVRFGLVLVGMDEGGRFIVVLCCLVRDLREANRAVRCHVPSSVRLHVHGLGVGSVEVGDGFSLLLVTLLMRTCTTQAISIWSSLACVFVWQDVKPN